MIRAESNRKFKLPLIIKWINWFTYWKAKNEVDFRKSLISSMALVLIVPWSLLFVKSQFHFQTGFSFNERWTSQSSQSHSHPYKTKTWPKIRPSPVSVPGRKEKDFTDRFKPVRVHTCTLLKYPSQPPGHFQWKNTCWRRATALSSAV